jgi:hypothetical protein
MICAIRKTNGHYKNNKFWINKINHLEIKNQTLEECGLFLVKNAAKSTTLE